MFKNYREEAGEDQKCLGRQRFIESKPFFVTQGTDKDRAACTCSYCFNFHELRRSVELILDKVYPSTDAFLDDQENITQILHSTLPTRKTTFTQFVKVEFNKRTTTITETTMASGIELAGAMDEQCSFYASHRIRVQEDKDFIPLIKARTLQNRNAIYGVHDYSENLLIQDSNECQDAHMSRQSMTLHVSVIYWMSYSLFMFHGGDFSSHGPELAGKSLVDAKKIIEKLFDTKIDHIVSQSDNCTVGNLRKKNKYI